MISKYDYFIIGVYLLFILIMGLVFRRMSKNTSDYFRAGGAMPWWITGTSAWIASFSAWTFTGAAGKVFETGTLVLVVFYSAVIGLGIVITYTCVRFRRMRVVTWMEAVRARYGSFNEQFYTWIKLPLLLLFSGIALNAIGVFMASVFKMDMNTVLIVLGVVVTVLAFTGGSWAVLASDFVQMFMVMTITISTAILVLLRPEIGGLSGLVHQVPSAHFHWAELARPHVILIWILVMVWFKSSDQNNIENSTMYLMAKSDKDARRMVLIPMIGTLIGPLIWFIPSMAATILHPNLAAEFPNLTQPHEAAFVAVALDVMPQGLLGLLLCAMLGATVTSMDAGLNKGVGVFVRSFYKPLGEWFGDFAKTNPKNRTAVRLHLLMLGNNRCERRLLLVGKLCTITFGVIIICVALLVNQFRTMGLFDLGNQLAANLLMPLALPLIYGLFIKRTPSWSAWSTALVGGSASYLLGLWIKPVMFQRLMGWESPLNPRETTDFLLATTTFGTVVIGSAWYFWTMFFYEKSSQTNKDRTEAFFLNLRTPMAEEVSGGAETTVYRLLGGLCIAYGIFILTLILIPNQFLGRMCFVFCGGVILIAGLILWVIGGRRRKSEADEVAKDVAH